MSNPFRSLVRVMGFVNKEGIEIFHQPRLVATLRTLFVVPDGDPIRQEILRYAPRLGPQIIFTGIADNSAIAQKRLLRREVDLVVVAPSGAY